MAFVITSRCVGVVDRGCVDACPVDCIYEGDGMLHIHPDDCIDCQACMAVCPAQAIYEASELPAEYRTAAADARRWFRDHPDAKVALGSFPSPAADAPSSSSSSKEGRKR
jgi:NAD-dependent dihydropyrimidine dehydrogenase PreA subunit